MGRWWLGAAIIAAVTLWAAWALQPLLIPLLGGHWTPETAGQWGDSFGALNALVAAGAFVGVIITLRLQQNEITATNREQHRQRFESSFFQLLDLMRLLRSEISVKFRDHITLEVISIRGVEAIDRLLLPIHDSVKNPYAPISTNDESDPIALLLLPYIEDVQVSSGNTLGPYFRVIYNMLDRLRRDNTLTIEEKDEYARLLRGQLNADELILISINALTPVSKDMRLLLTMYRMLKYVPAGRIRTVLEFAYPQEAFMGRRATTS